MDALRIVANVSVNEIVAERDALRNELAEVKKALDAVVSKAAEDREKYLKLVWFARNNRDGVLSDVSHPSRSAILEIMDKYESDVEKLSGQNGNYCHGFNSGMLAAARLYGGLTVAYEEDLCEDLGGYDSGEEIPSMSQRLESLRQDTLDEFPMLDT